MICFGDKNHATAPQELPRLTLRGIGNIAAGGVSHWTL
jgi:hypothetical protein